MREKIRAEFKRLLHLDDPPHRIATAFALGVFMAFSPLVGFHTVLALLLAYVFRLNPAVVLFGSFVNNPWTFAPIFAGSSWVGVKLYGLRRPLPPFDWESSSLSDLLIDLKPYLVPFFLGTTLMGLVAALASYPLILYLVTAYRRRHQHL